MRTAMACVLAAAGCWSSSQPLARDEAPAGSSTVPAAKQKDEAMTDDSGIDIAALENVKPYPNARSLTGGHVNGGPGGMHITWSTSATVDEAARVVAHYEQALGTKAEHDGKTWAFRASLDDGSSYRGRTLEIIPAALAKDFPGREVPPSAAERTVVLSSSAVGRSRK